MSARAELICSQADPPLILGGVVPHTDLTVRSETGACVSVLGPASRDPR
jgi:hypothetical protein